MGTIKKIKKISLVAILIFALILGVGARSAQATLTLDATSVVSSAALGLSGAAGSAITIGNAAQTATITLGSSTADGIVDIGAGTGVTTVKLGVSSGADVVTVGDADADVSIVDAQWGVTAAGAATFQSTLTTGNITAYGAGADQAFTVASKGAGTLTLDPTGAGAVVIGSADVLSLTVTTDGTGTAEVALPAGSIDSTEVLDNTLTASDLNATLTFADADLVDFGTNVTSATEGLLLPKHATDCSTATAEGQVCWQADTNVLYVGDNAAAVAVAGSTGAANTWTDNQIFTFAGDEDIAIANTTATTVDTFSVATTTTNSADAAQISFTLGADDAGVDTVAGLRVAVTSSNTAVADVVQGISIDNLTSADAEALEHALTIGTGWDQDLRFADTGVQIVIADGGTFTFENATGADFLTLTATAGVLAGDLTVTGGDITVSGEASAFTIIDNTANALVIESVTDGLDYLAITTTDGSETMVLGHSTVDSITLTTDGTGTAEVVLPAGSIDSTEILNATIAEADIAASSAAGLGVLRTARAIYDFSVDGGVTGAITPASTAVLPDNAVIVAATINSTTAVTSGGAATLAVGTTAGSSATSILAATAKASLSADALINGVPVFSTPLKMSAAGSINVTVGTADLTAGVVEITLLYFVAAN